MDNPGKDAKAEGELIRAATDGNRSAFNELVRLKRERVVRIAYQVTGDWDDALDVAQGVFLRLWKNLDRYDPERRFDTWLYRVTANAAIDMLRSRGPKGHLQPLPEDHGELSDETAEDAVSLLGAAELQRAFKRLADCKLQTVEAEVLGRGRLDDIPGRLIPDAYRQYVLDGDTDAMCRVLQHNALDLITVLEIAALLAPPACRQEE